MIRELPSLQQNNASPVILRIRHPQIILGLIALMFLADAATTLLSQLNSPFWRVSIVVRGAVQAYLLILLLRHRQGRMVAGLVFGLFALVLIAALLALLKGQEYNLFDNVNMVAKMSFFFICWKVFQIYFEDNPARNKLFRLFEIIILIQALSVIAGFLFNIDFLSSYGSKRFGYKGLIPARNEVSGFFLIGFFYFLWKFNLTRQGLYSLLIILLASLLTGAKNTLILPVIFALFVTKWVLTRISSRTTWIVLLISLLGVAGVIVEWEAILKLIQPTLNYFAYHRSTGGNPNLLSSFFSGRDQFAIQILAYVRQNFTLLNVFFGGYNLSMRGSETDFLDVFLLIGVVGMVLFYLPYVMILFRHPNHKLDLTHLLFAFAWIGMSALAGHLVFSAVNGPYLAIILLAFSSHKKDLLPE